MPLRQIQMFQKEILKGQIAPPDLRALLEIAAHAGKDDIDPICEALRYSLLVPGRDYPLLTGSYLNDSDRQNPRIMANVAAIDELIALITFVATSDDGDMIGYWHGPERTPIETALIVKLDTEGQFDLMQGRNLAEAMLGDNTFSDPEGFATGRRWLADCGITVDATDWRELATPECAVQPSALHRTLCNERRIAAGLQPIG
ncbi:hypothetical protein Q3C01_15180 [Bradyrhizobium sp. UFLA05-109]